MTFLHNSAVSGATYFLCSVGYLLMGVVLAGELKRGSHRFDDWGLFGLLSVYGLVRGVYHFAELFFLISFQRSTAVTAGGLHELVWVAGDYLTVLIFLTYAWRLLQLHRPLGLRLHRVWLGLLVFWAWVVAQASALGYDLGSVEVWHDLKPFLICLPSYAIVSYSFWRLGREYGILGYSQRSRRFLVLSLAFICQAFLVLVLASLNLTSKSPHLGLSLDSWIHAMGFMRAGALLGTVYLLYLTLSSEDELKRPNLKLSESGLAVASQFAASVVNLACHVARADGAVAVLYERGGQGRETVRSLAVQGLPPSLLAYLSGETVNLQFLGSDLKDRYGAMHTVPIRGESGALGELIVVRSRRNPFSEMDRGLLESLGKEMAHTLAGLAQLMDVVEARAIQDERLRISREMHDGLSPLLAYLRIKVESAKTLLDERDDQPVSATLGEIDKVVTEALADVRESIAGLRWTMTEENMDEKLSSYVSSFEHRTGLRVISNTKSFPSGLPPKVETQVLRIVQEALTNVRKHAQATEVQLGLEIVGRELIVTIRDNGRGFDQKDVGEGHYGLSTMRERCSDLGGLLEIISSYGHGTTVRLSVPVDVKEERLFAADQSDGSGRSRVVSRGVGQPDFV